jgi:sugar lactone lactonase YvrE
VDAELFLEAGDLLGEGPIWDDREERLYWVDMFGDAVRAVDASGAKAMRAQMPATVGFVALRRSGGLLVAVRDGFVTLSADLDRSQPYLPTRWDVPGMSWNDGACDAAGRLWAGTSTDDGSPGVAALWRLDPDRSLTRVADGLTISNGIDWDLTGRRMYHVDSPTRRIDVLAFDPERGTMSGRRSFATVDTGLPDGLTVDADGGVWVALWDGWAVNRYTSDGRLDRTIRLPVARVTSCAFGGARLDRLFITTARYGLDAAALRDQPLAGSLFVAEPGVTGRPAGRYAGA